MSDTTLTNPQSDQETNRLRSTAQTWGHDACCLVGGFFESIVGIVYVALTFMPIIVVFLLALGSFDLYSNLARGIEKLEDAYHSDALLVLNETAEARQELSYLTATVKNQFEQLNESIHSAIAYLETQAAHIENAVVNDIHTVTANTKAMAEAFGKIEQGFESVENVFKSIPTSLSIPDIHFGHFPFIGDIKIPMPHLSFRWLLQPLVNVFTNNPLTEGVKEVEIAIKAAASSFSDTAKIISEAEEAVTFAEVNYVVAEVGKIAQTLRLAAHVGFHEIHQVILLMELVEKNTVSIIGKDKITTGFVVYAVIAQLLTIVWAVYIYVAYYVMGPLTSGMHWIFGTKESPKCTCNCAAIRHCAKRCRAIRHYVNRYCAYDCGPCKNKETLSPVSTVLKIASFSQEHGEQVNSVC